MAIGSTTKGTDALFKKTGFDRLKDQPAGSTGKSIFDKVKEILDRQAEIKASAQCRSFTCGARDLQRFPDPYPKTPDPLVPPKTALMFESSGPRVAFAVRTDVEEVSAALTESRVTNIAQSEPGTLRSSWASPFAPDADVRELLRASESPLLLADTGGGGGGAGGGHTVGQPAATPGAAAEKSCKAFYGPVSSAGDAYINGSFALAIAGVAFVLAFDVSLSTSVESVSITSGNCNPPDCTDEVLTATIRAKYSGNVKIYVEVGSVTVPLLGKIGAGIQGAVTFGLGCVDFVECEVKCT